jgi:hypothetical protein
MTRQPNAEYLMEPFGRSINGVRIAAGSDGIDLEVTYTPARGSMTATHTLYSRHLTKLP